MSTSDSPLRALIEKWRKREHDLAIRAETARDNTTFHRSEAAQYEVNLCAEELAALAQQREKEMQESLRAGTNEAGAEVQPPHPSTGDRSAAIKILKTLETDILATHFVAFSEPAEEYVAPIEKLFMDWRGRILTALENLKEGR